MAVELSQESFAAIIRSNTGMVNGCVDKAAAEIWQKVAAYIEETEDRIINAEFAKTEAENKFAERGG